MWFVPELATKCPPLLVVALAGFNGSFVGSNCTDVPTGSWPKAASNELHDLVSNTNHRVQIYPFVSVIEPEFEGSAQRAFSALLHHQTIVVPMVCNVSPVVLSQWQKSPIDIATAVLANGPAAEIATDEATITSIIVFSSIPTFILVAYVLCKLKHH
mgnify:FL=1|tara:strand:+ start:4399 stop:4869 length:471 start_codon:yes stop_codon:yes gene_type:complete